MAISCGQCGRQYDVTLFEFGRTISCVCGERVAFEHRICLSKSNELKFFADVNVARLARFLRACGIDTSWEDEIADGDLVRRAIREGRFVLTLDKGILEEWSADNIFLLSSEKPPEQLQEVIEYFEIKKPKEFFTRCLICNSRVRNATEKEIKRHAPPNFAEEDCEFYCCENCGKLYWDGSHTKRMRWVIKEIFAKIKK